MTKYPCYVCLDNCEDYCIYCETCESWSHYRCQDIDRSAREEWRKNVKLGYICIRCRTHEDGNFDYLMGLQRLTLASKHGLQKLTKAAERESLFLKNVPLETSLHSDFNDFTQDDVANTLLAHFHASDKVALRSSPDGDCLFNSVSILLNGDESRASELRYRCCIEMTTNRSRIKIHPLYKRLTSVSPAYEDDCIDCASPGRFSSMHMCIALSRLLNLQLQFSFPAVNGANTYTFKVMNTTLRPPFVDPDQQPLSIMWTSLELPRNKPTPKDPWTPNHFVPLVDSIARGPIKTMKEMFEPTEPHASHNPSTVVQTTNKFQALAENDNGDIVTTEDDRITLSSVGNVGSHLRDAAHGAPTLPTEVNGYSPGKFINDLSVVIEEDEGRSSLSPQLTPTPTPAPTPPPPSTSTQSPPSTPPSMRAPSPPSTPPSMPAPSPSPPSTPPSMPAISPPSTPPSMPAPSPPSTPEQMTPPSTTISPPPSPASSSPYGYSDDFTPGPLSKFMDIKDICAILSGPFTALADIPIGRKDGYYYVVDNSANLTRKSKGQRSEFWDDCGAWGKGTSPSFTFLHRSDRLTTVYHRDGSYCTEKNINKKRVFQPISPQPSDGEILIVRRLYNSLSASDQFKRRCTWVAKAPDTMAALSTTSVLVEYIGTFPDRIPHGRSRDGNGPSYIRTKPEVRQSLKQQLQSASVKEVERAFNKSTQDDYSKQRNEKQLRNFKYQITKTSDTPSNLADQVIHIEEMVKHHEFVYSVKHMKGNNHPVITLMTDQQIRDIKRFCATGKTVLGLDKTYNLGDFHVTPTVYKDLSVLRRSTQNHPITFGPTFIHTNSSARTYSSFLHDIADNLKENEVNSLIIGSDEEKAFLVAVERCFQGATHTLCTRHLRQNCNNYMEDIVGYPKSERIQVSNAIFGDDGIITSKDDDTLDYRTHQLKREIAKLDDSVGEKKFLPYFSDKVMPTLEKFVIAPIVSKKVPLLWTNNNCESANHILKTAIKWKATDLPKFITLLYDIVVNEQTERSRAIRGTGNYELDPAYAHHRTEMDKWANMSQLSRDQRERRFRNDKGRDNANLVISTNGQRAVQRTPSAGKKPNQVKRKRAERSRTPTAKRRLPE